VLSLFLGSSEAALFAFSLAVKISSPSPTQSQGDLKVHNITNSSKFEMAIPECNATNTEQMNSDFAH